MIRFPYSRPDITDADIDAVVQSLRSQYLTQGQALEEFEDALAKRLGARHAIVCNSGTAALHLAYMALKLGTGRGLLTGPITFLATANAARMCGADVRFADVDPDTGNITAITVEKALDEDGDSIAAVTAIHLGGRACEMAGLRELTTSKGLALVEDACHAPLAHYRDAAGEAHAVGCCEHSDVAVFSFHAIKHLAMGEGGAVMTNDDEIAASCRLMRNHGMTRDPATWRNAPEPGAPWYYEMHHVGWNYRAGEMQCALGLSQLARLDESIARRREIAAAYDSELAGLNNVRTPPPDDGHVWHLYPLAVDFDAVGKPRGQVMRELTEKGIGTQVHYIPLYHQPYYSNLVEEPLPGVEKYYARTLSIPMYPSLSDGDIEEIALAIRQVVSD